MTEQSPDLHSDRGFLKSHGLLHQDAVDQLVEPVFMVVEPDDVVDGPEPGGGSWRMRSNGIGPNRR